MEWKNLTDGSFKGFRFHCATPSKKDGVHGISSQKTVKERRLQVTNFPGRNGARVGDLGGNSDTVEFDIIFHGSNYQKQYENFLATLDNGEAGILVCPVRSRAIIAYFHKLAESIEVGAGGSIRVSATFVEDTTIDPIDLGSSQEAMQKPSEDKSASLLDKIKSAKNALNSNPFIDAVRAVESGISTVRRYAGAVIALDQNIRSRIVSLTAEITSTLDLVNDAVAIFKKEEKAPTNQNNIIDPDTGLEVVPFDRDITLPEVDDPLAPPINSDVNTDTVPELSTNNLESNAGLEVFSDKALEMIKDGREEMGELGGGKTEDVTSSLREVVLALDDFKSSIAVQVGTPKIVPREISIIEVLFENSLPLSSMKQVISNNRHIDDFVVIPRGTIIYL